MNRRSLILLIVAAFVAAITAFAVRNRLHQGEEQQPVAVSNKILVASTDIPAGSFIRSDTQLKWVDWPEATMQPTYITQSSRKIEEFNGAVARRAITNGEPVTDALLVKTSEGGFMSAVLQGGMRAVSIAVNPTSGNAGFVFPGDHVDLIVTHSISVPGENGAAQNVVASETFVENVRVLAVDQMLDNPENKAVLAKTVTLEVTPKQAEMVNVAADLGKISLALRSLANTKALGPAGETAVAIPQGGMTRDTDVSPMMAAPGGVASPVNVIRGDKSEKMQFNQQGQ